MSSSKYCGRNIFSVGVAARQCGRICSGDHNGTHCCRCTGYCYFLFLSTIWLTAKSEQRNRNIFFPLYLVQVMKAEDHFWIYLWHIIIYFFDIAIQTRMYLKVKYFLAILHHNKNHFWINKWINAFFLLLPKHNLSLCFKVSLKYLKYMATASFIYFWFQLWYCLPIIMKTR